MSNDVSVVAKKIIARLKAGLDFSRERNSWCCAGYEDAIRIVTEEFGKFICGIKEKPDAD